MKIRHIPAQMADVKHQIFRQLSRVAPNDQPTPEGAKPNL